MRSTLVETQGGAFMREIEPGVFLLIEKDPRLPGESTEECGLRLIREGKRYCDRCGMLTGGAPTCNCGGKAITPEYPK